MTVEPATYLSSLVATSPTHTDPLSEFDGHVRLIKTVLQSTFPNLNAPVTLTPTQLNALTGAILAGGGQNISGTFGVIDPSTTNGVSVTVSAASSANGVGIKLVGNGATTTSKTLQVKGGVLSILSDAGGPIWTLSDTGSVAFPGALTTGAHTATALTSTGAVAGLSGAFTGTLTSGTSLNSPSILKSPQRRRRPPVRRTAEPPLKTPVTQRRPSLKDARHSKTPVTQRRPLLKTAQSGFTRRVIRSRRRLLRNAVVARGRNIPPR